MTIKRCLITAEELKTKTEINRGYSTKGMKYLMGSNKIKTELPFTRKKFIQVEPINQEGMSISGYQPKLSVCISNDEFNVVKNKATYILKPSPEQFNMLAENEHAIMLVMKKLKFDVAPFGLVSFAKENESDKTEYVFVTKRYDRISADEKIHQEQLDGAMGVKDKYGKVNDVQVVSYEQMCNFVIKALKGSLTLKKDLFRRVLYAYLLGNNDLHLRNVGLLRPKTDDDSLAPVYDYVSTVPYFEGDILALPLLALEENETELAPGLNHSGFGIYTGYDFILFGKGIGLVDKLIKKILDEACSEKHCDLVITTIENSFMNEKDKAKVISCFKGRIKAIKHIVYAAI
ncbi:HipA domain-containing protein [Psychromonas sp. SP041]|uniref:type II toxin-antitoxin system HipA family toxin n=1 Tax=Psychromonas sp. SP041 TaxID=1365007 RepID=UPI000408677B|nr:HipA domain-containing protein [Psychromonas sp. SP041]